MSDDHPSTPPQAHDPTPEHSPNISMTSSSPSHSHPQPHTPPPEHTTPQQSPEITPRVTSNTHQMTGSMAGLSFRGPSEGVTQLGKRNFSAISTAMTMSGREEEGEGGLGEGVGLGLELSQGAPSASSSGPVGEHQSVTTSSDGQTGGAVVPTTSAQQVLSQQGQSQQAQHQQAQHQQSHDQQTQNRQTQNQQAQNQQAQTQQPQLQQAQTQQVQGQQAQTSQAPVQHSQNQQTQLPQAQPQPAQPQPTLPQQAQTQQAPIQQAQGQQQAQGPIEEVEDERGSYSSPTVPAPTPSGGPEEIEEQPPAETPSRTRFRPHFPSDPLPVRLDQVVKPSLLRYVPQDWRIAIFESEKAEYRKTSLPKWREPSGTQMIEAPSGEMVWVDPFASPTIPRAIVPVFEIPPEFTVEDFNAARIGLYAMEMLADDLKSGELHPMDLDWQERRSAYRCIMMQDKGEARTLFPSHPDRDMVPAREFDVVELDRTAAYTIRSPMKWAKPNLHVIFELLAAESSFKETTRLYGFECGKIFSCHPTPVEPHIISLISTQPCCTEFRDLYLTVSELVSAGGHADVYRGILHTYPFGEPKVHGDIDDRQVVIKVICPRAFDDDPRYPGSTQREARQSMINEVYTYNQTGAPLQGEVIPRFYGLWEWVGHLRKSDGSENMIDRRHKVFIELLEDVGISMNQRFGFPQDHSPELLRNTHKLEIIAAYVQLHKLKIHHGFLSPETIRWNPMIEYPSIDSGIRLIDFTHSLNVRYMGQCRDEIMYLQEIYQITSREVDICFGQLRDNGEVFSYYDDLADE
ncbi:hypothetical protein I302_106169 [Kwoniella bestiolae CBS 10118]|uniref:Protein kinase domain-containing protein n=1 Tax=Kwoniella bestiolae CBS 10118 TaxID=1296100 RepID=A0A1B9G390_9TREE|nr:hypothetical protein I302_05292 [Kwoniella bestiolae CBS 10118]OCF25472.1 hypothetical protein I302_05292 [Kwoniella bestiolae CBS 10118]